MNMAMRVGTARGAPSVSKKKLPASLAIDFMDKSAAYHVAVATTNTQAFAA
jgi:hypothetical protein